MKIKRITASDMRQALRVVREQLGPDAVILSNRSTEGGVMVVAAVDYDAAALEARLDETEAAPPPPTPAAQVPSDPVSFYEDELATAVDAAPTPPASPSPDATAQIEGVRREVEGLRQLLECQLASLAWNELHRGNPLQVTALQKLSAMGVETRLARDVVDSLPRLSSPDEGERKSLSELARRLPVVADDLVENGGIVAVVGATGVGKTTTVAKLAARFVMRHGPEHVCLLSTDTYRIGAREQLLSYARILGTPMFVARDRQELASLLAAQSHRRLVLIDTAGVSRRDQRLAEQFALLRSQGARTRILLALSAASDFATLDDLVATYADVRPGACVLTKLDEAASFGPALSVLTRHGLPLAWCCNGQRVPEDIHAAHNKRMWFVSTASRLAKARPLAVDERVLARRYAEAELHA